jgi:hypothetical protein
MSVLYLAVKSPVACIRICLYSTYNAWRSRSCRNLCNSCYNCSLVPWTVVSLTSAKLKPLTFSLSGFTLSDIANNFHSHGFVWPLFVTCTISLCSHKYTVRGKPFAIRGQVCALEMHRYCGEPCFVSTAISKCWHLQQILRRCKH